MLKLFQLFTLFMLSSTAFSQHNLTGTNWINYHHMEHKKVIEFVPSTGIDSIYKEVHDDYHYGWRFTNDSVMDITKEHWIYGTQKQLNKTKRDYNYFEPPTEQYVFDVDNYLKDPPILSLHTWDHVNATYKTADSMINISYNGEIRTYIILECRSDYLKVKLKKK